MIGNPPYGVNLTGNEKIYLAKKFWKATGEIEIYSFFIELSLKSILKPVGIFSFITTNTIYYLDKFASVRENAFLANKVVSLIELEKHVFADAPDIVPAIYVIEKTESPTNLIKLYKALTTNRVYDLNTFVGFGISSILQSKVLQKKNFVFNLRTNELKELIINRLSKFKTIKDEYKVVYGIKTGDNQRFLSKVNIGKENWRKCISSADNVKKYQINWKGDYLNVSKDLAGLNKINYEQPKILVQYIRKLSMPIRLVSAWDAQGEYYPLNNFSFIVSQRENSLGFLLALLNSKLLNWYFSNCFIDYNIKPKYLEQLPLPNVLESDELDEKITQLISLKHQNASTTLLETEIDQLVYQLYELTEEEIKIIEGDAVA